MPLYKTNKDIFKDFGEEVFDYRFNKETRYILKTKDWDYKRELKVEDVEIWEVLFEDSWGLGVYAAYEPYAEFYMIKYADSTGNHVYDTHYGAGAQNKIMQFMVSNNIPFNLHDVYVDEDKTWLYFSESEKKIIIT
jgi:hypothetical protein